MKQTLDQERAKYAWECVSDVSDIDTYANVVKSSANLVVNNGLMQTLAFLEGKSKKGNSQEHLLRHLCNWLQRRVFCANNDSGFEKTMDSLYQSSSDRYMQSTNEVIAIFSWLRQLADAKKSIVLTSDQKSTGINL